jgi:hypothetical protein
MVSEAPSGDEVKARLRAAFAGTVAPEADAVTHHHACPECDEVAGVLGGLHWTEVTPPHVSKVRQALPLLLPAAFRHYLPAFMICAIDDREAVDTMWLSLILQLKPRRGADFEAHVQGFSEEQSRAIATFLEWQREADREEQGGLHDEKTDGWFTKAIAYWKAR